LSDLLGISVKGKVQVHLTAMPSRNALTWVGGEAGGKVIVGTESVKPKKVVPIPKTQSISYYLGR
jgi:hypothetical protein